MTMLTKRRQIAVKVEGTPGTLESLANADAALNVFDATINPQVDFAERPGQGGFSHLPQVGGARMGQASFRTQLIGGATLPLWAVRLLPACGFVEDTRVFGPVSAPPGTAAGVKTLSIGMYEDGVKKALAGCMGNAVLTFLNGRVVDINWTFTGKWVDPADVALLTPTYPAEAANLPRFADTGLAIGSWSPKISRLTLDLGNQVTMIEDADGGDATGYRHAAITGRRVSGTIDPESTLVATNDAYGDWLALAEAALGFQVGPDAYGVAFAAPKFQVIGISEGDRNGLQVDQINFQCNRSASAGDDELTLEFTEAS